MNQSINIVIPMAGYGSRFAQAGYEKPKPFIDIDGEAMIEKVMKNMHLSNANFILIGRKEHLEKEQEMVQKLTQKYNAVFIGIDGVTEGTACTVLYTKKLIDNDIPLLIANSDQLVDIDIETFVKDNFERNLDGSILCFEDKHLSPKWSFAKIDDAGLVTQVKEKVAISSNATVGIYLFSKGSTFVNAAIDMIVRNERVNNEFYTCPVYNYAINEGKKIGVFLIDFKQMHGLGTPEDLEEYLALKNV
jgi:NDP-sugar pyrophosphorylase family protein